VTPLKTSSSLHYATPVGKKSYYWSNTKVIITGSIACSTKRRYLSYSEGDFEVFLPCGATRCTDGGEIWHGGVLRVTLKTENFTKFLNIYAP